jgi:undecaprenyl-diphosphatase
MTLLNAIILGIIQGIGEFLPISSSGHLLFVPWLFNWEYQDSLTFDVALHVGTLIAVLAFFWKDWFILIKDGLTKGIKTFEGKMFWCLVVASIPGAIAGALLDEVAENVFRGPLMPIILACSLAIMGILLFFADRYGKQERDYEKMTFLDTLLIGISQAFAVIPGTSRSGVTMTMARALGVTREAAAKFSFLLSTPIIAGAALYKFVLKPDELAMGELFSLPCIVGVLTAMVVGFLSIAFLMKYLKKSNFNVFVIYRVVIAVILVVTYIIRVK